MPTGKSNLHEILYYNTISMDPWVPPFSFRNIWFAFKECDFCNWEYVDNSSFNEIVEVLLFQIVLTFNIHGKQMDFYLKN